MRSLLRVSITLCVITFHAALSAPIRDVGQILDQLRVKAKNSGWTFTVGNNEAMSHSLQEITGYKKDPNSHQHAMYGSPAPLSLPSSWDWRTQVDGGLTPIKNQGSCGGCWAFGTVAVFENLMKIRDGVTHILSEQQLISCNHDGWSCGGGDFAHQYHVSPGAALQQDFPYAMSDVRCKSNLATNDKIESWAYVGASADATPTTDEVKQAIYQYGPVSITVAASDSFQGYTSGIYNANDSTDTNHLVALVGWNDDGGYWILRNSWGVSWGEQGYMRIKYGVNAVAEQAAYVTYKTACTPQPIAYAGDPVTVAGGSNVRLGGLPIPGQTYSWSPTTGLDDPTSATPFATPTTTTTYTLTTQTNCGSATQSVTITVGQ